MANLYINGKNKQTTLGGEAVILSISKVITLCINMITARLLSEFTTLEEYGTYSQLLLIVNVASAIFMLGLPNCINYFLARAENQDKKKHFLSVYYTLSTTLSIIMGVVLMCSVRLMVRYFDNPNINGFLYFFAIYPWASIISGSIENILIVYHRSSLLLWFKIFNSICLLGTVMLIQFLKLGFSEYMIVYVAIYALFAIFVYIISGKLCGGLAFSFDINLIKTIFAFSLPIGLATVVGTLDIEIDKLLIGLFMDTEQMAIYTNASKELPVTVIATSITAVLMPKMSNLLMHEKKEKAVKLWNVATELSFIFMALFVAGMFMYGKDVLNILYSSKYLPGLAVFRIYTLVLLLRVTYFGIILNANGETTKILWCSIAALIANIILNPLFYQFMGMIGPAIATLISMLSISLFQLYLTAKSTKVHFKHIFPWKRIGILLIINFAFSIVFGSIKYVIPLDLYITSVGEALVLGTVWTFSYIVLLRKRILFLWNSLNDVESENG